MVDSIVSVRMPSSLVQELKQLSKENHFMDVSEEIRSIIKIKSREQRSKIEGRSELAEAPVDYKTENMVKEELVKRLKEIIKKLENQ